MNWATNQYINHHHHHVALLARISMTISLYPSLLFIILGRSSMQYHVSAQSWSMYVFAGQPTLACPCAGFHRRTSLMISSLLLQQCPTCLVRLTRMVWVICGRWPYSCFLVGCCVHVLFRITRSTYIDQLCADTGCCIEDLLRMMSNRDG